MIINYPSPLFRKIGLLFKCATNLGIRLKDAEIFLWEFPFMAREYAEWFDIAEDDEFWTLHALYLLKYSR